MEVNERIAVLETQNRDIIKKLDEISIKLDCLDQKYVSVIEFNPVRRIVYGLVGTVLLTVLGAVLTVVISDKI